MLKNRDQKCDLLPGVGKILKQSDQKCTRKWTLTQKCARKWTLPQKRARKCARTWTLPKSAPESPAELFQFCLQCCVHVLFAFMIACVFLAALCECIFFALVVAFVIAFVFLVAFCDCGFLFVLLFF